MKQIISVMLLVLVLCSCFSFSAFAAEPTIVLSSETAVPGEKVTLTVSVKNNPGVSAMYLDIRYDSNLKLVGVKDLGLFGGAMFSEKLSSYPYRLTWDEAFSKKLNNQNGVIAELVFYVPQEAYEGTYSVAVSYNSEEIYGRDFENIDFTVKNGEIKVEREGTFSDNEKAKLYNEYIIFAPDVTVAEVLVGASKGSMIYCGNKALSEKSLLTSGNTLVFPNDVILVCVCIGDLDGKQGITAGDARMALRAAVDLEKLEAWQKTAADADKSGEISSQDARLILRASVGLENTKEWYNSFSYSIIKFDRFETYENDYVSNDADFVAAGKYIANKVSNLEESVDISQFRIRKEDAELLVGEYIFYVPRYFYVGSSIGLESENGYLTTLSFTYSETAERDIEIYREEISRLVRLSDESWTDLEIALFYHDYICSAYKYDTNLNIYDAFTLITEKEGVCQANALLYTELLSMCGVPVKFVSSKKMAHAWNMVQIDGEWYHVDITWDDPVNDRYGLASHKFFLLSDSKMTKNKHYGWMVFAEDIYCTSTKYDNYFWQQSESPFVPFKDNWYYVGPSSSGFALYRTDLKNKGSEMMSFSDVWKTSYYSSWDGVYSGLGVFNNMLVFNTPDQIIAYDVNTESSTVLFSEDYSSRCIFGLFAEDNICYHLNSSPDPVRQSIFTLDIPRTGDVNCDGYINAKDCTVLIQYANNYDVDCDLTAADFDVNGSIEEKDAKDLRYCIINKM